MELILQLGALCVAISGIWAFFNKLQSKMLEPLKMMVENSQRTVEDNQVTMRSLQNSINSLSDGLKENQFNFKTSAEDRKVLHKVQGHHEARIGIAEDKIIVLEEQTKTLFKNKEDKR